jgi:hypothetical protein
LLESHRPWIVKYILDYLWLRTSAEEYLLYTVCLYSSCQYCSPNAPGWRFTYTAKEVAYILAQKFIVSSDTNISAPPWEFSDTLLLISFQVCHFTKWTLYGMWWFICLRSGRIEVSVLHNTECIFDVPKYSPVKLKQRWF